MVFGFNNNHNAVLLQAISPAIFARPGDALPLELLRLGRSGPVVNEHAVVAIVVIPLYSDNPAVYKHAVVAFIVIPGHRRHLAVNEQLAVVLTETPLPRWRPRHYLHFGSKASAAFADALDALLLAMAKALELRSGDLRSVFAAIVVVVIIVTNNWVDGGSHEGHQKQKEERE